MRRFIAILTLLVIGGSFGDDTVFILLNNNETDWSTQNVSLATTVGPSGNCVGNEIDRKARIFLSECAQLCKETSRCVGAAYHPNTRRCWLKSSMDACHPVPDSIITLYPNLDCESNDIETIKHLDLSSCVTKCGETTHCSGVQYNSEKECILKSTKDDCDTSSGGLLVWVHKPREQQVPPRGYVCHGGRQVGEANGFDATVCKELCSNEASCVAFSYDREKKKCLFRSAMENCTSVTDPVVMIRPNYDCGSNDIASPRVPTFDKCIEKCRKNPRCVAASYDQREVCNLKSRMDGNPIACDPTSRYTAAFVAGPNPAS